VHPGRPRLEGKVAVVTGAGSSGPGIGTGRATSVLFARAGAKVVLVDRVASRAEETLATIRDEGGEGAVCEADVTGARDCERMVAMATERYGRLDILVNNVGMLSFGSALDVTEEEWDQVFNVNLKSMMLTSKFAIPQMIRGGGGSIINISSIAALRAATGKAIIPYAASKGGVIALTTEMAVYHGRDNIRVNCIVPGHIYTPLVAGGTTEEMRELRKRAAPLGTEGTAWDIAWAAVYLASDEARWITAVMLPVDGGVLATTPLAMLHHLR